MRFLINKWSNSKTNGCAPMLNTYDEDAFLSKRKAIKNTTQIYCERCVIWPELTVWSYATNIEAMNAMAQSELCDKPLYYQFVNRRRDTNGKHQSSLA